MGDQVIQRFVGRHWFLSNFYPAQVMLSGMLFPSVENAYQAAKNNSRTYRAMLASVSPGQARRAGRTVLIRTDWEQIKVKVMLLLLRDKFNDPELATQLLCTGTAKLEEGNNWGDVYWGTVNGQGRNQLGLLLMAVRGELRFRYGSLEAKGDA